jgi:predicted transcriptional regulator
MQTGQPTGIITEADISRAVADGKNPNDVRIYELMTTNPTVVNTTASIRDAAKIMTSPGERLVSGTLGIWVAGIAGPPDPSESSQRRVPSRPQE